MSVEGIFKGITRAKKEGNSIEGTGGQKRGQTRNCNLPMPSLQMREKNPEEELKEAFRVFDAEGTGVIGHFDDDISLDFALY